MRMQRLYTRPSLLGQQPSWAVQLLGQVRMHVPMAWAHIRIDAEFGVGGYALRLHAQIAPAFSLGERLG